MKWETAYFTDRQMVRRLIYIATVIYLFSSTIDAERFTSGGVLHPSQSAYDVLYYDLFFDVKPDRQFFSAISKTNILIIAPLDSIRFDLVDTFVVKKTFVNGIESQFSHNDNVLNISASVAVSNKIVGVEVHYSGHPPVAANPPWDGGFTWESDSSGNPWVGMSSANEGGKVFFPCKDHPSDRADSAAVSIAVPKGLTAASNGRLVNITHDKSGSIFNWKTRYPIANYNINFTIGKFHREQKMFTSISGRQMPAVFYILDQNRKKASTHLDMAMKMINSHETYFGEYPFINEKFGLVETPYLGMEHQTINAYGNQFRYTQLGGEPFDWLLLHELGHEWWGNSVNASDWADYWIHEGICTYADALYHRNVDGEEGYHKKMASARKGIKNEKPLIPKRNASTDEVYQGDIYGKGAYLLHSLRFIIGDEKFFLALKQFASSEEFTYKNLVSERDFVRHFSIVSDLELDSFISKMLYSTELPRKVVNEIKRNNFLLSVNGIDWLPVEVQIGDEIRRMNLTEDPVRVWASEKPEIDPNHWYLWSDDFHK